MLKEICQYIEDNTSFIIGTDLFAGHRPSNAPEECIVILEDAGGGTNFLLPDKVDKAVQVLSRAKTFFTARDNIYTIYELLHGKSWIELPVVVAGNEYIAMTIEAITVPQSIGQDERGLYEFSVNFIFRIKDK